MILYWVIAMIGIVDLDVGGESDVDLDLDADADANIEVDGSSEAAEGDGTSGGAWNSVMRFVGLSDAPIILILSIFALMLWALNLVANLYLNPGESAARASFLLIPVMILAFVVTRVSVRPLRPVMKILKSTEPALQVIGMTGIVKSTTLDEKFGRVEIESEGRPLLLDAVLTDDSTTLKKGDQILVVMKKDDSNIYIVRPI